MIVNGFILSGKTKQLLTPGRYTKPYNIKTFTVILHQFQNDVEKPNERSSNKSIFLVLDVIALYL